jgi:hypothetical protein
MISSAYLFEMLVRGRMESMLLAVSDGSEQIVGEIALLGRESQLLTREKIDSLLSMSARITAVLEEARGLFSEAE